MKRIMTAALAWLLMCGFMTGCVTGDEHDIQQGGAGDLPLEAKKLIQPDNGANNERYHAAASGANDFAFKLSSALVEQAGDNNFVCSPYSVWIPLAALLNATSKDSRPALLDAIGAAGLDVSDINETASRMLYDLTDQREQEYIRDYPDYYPKGYEHHNPIAIANAVFVGDNVTINQNFAQTFLDYYRGAVINVDFSSKDAVNTVNAWAAENTDGLIDNIVQGFDPDTLAAIANAIYFSDRWAWEFDPKKTEEGVFHAPDGDSTALFMLREGPSQQYYEDDKLQSTIISFTSQGGLCILLPKDGDASGLLSSMTGDDFKDILDGFSYNSTGKLLLPKFSIDSGVMTLNDVLTALGVPLFDVAAAPLTGVVQENIPMWLSNAVHKAVIDVDEKGTTAAAVTVMAMAGATAVVPTLPFEMICDRPFVFILFGHTYDGENQVLFTGVVNKP